MTRGFGRDVKGILRAGRGAARPRRRCVAALATALTVAVSTLGAGCGVHATKRTSMSTPVLPSSPGAFSPSVRADCPALPAGWVRTENTRPGGLGWRAATPGVASAVGWTDRASVSCGQKVRLFVTTNAANFRVEAWRLGVYGGRGGRLIWRSARLPGRGQPRAQLVSAGREVVAPWRVSTTIAISRRWIPGDYLLELRTPSGRSGLVPLTVRPPAGSHVDLTFVNATGTWQVYNRWGGYSGYAGPSGFASRSLVVSADRPYDAHLRLDYLDGELPLLRELEQLGWDTYTETTADLDSGNIGGRPRAIIFGWHDEYVTGPGRRTLQRAANSGINLGFFGANQIYWRPRYPVTGAGTVDLRQQIIDRLPADDPYRNDAALATTRWRDAPIDQPEQNLLGEQANPTCLNVDAPMTVTGSWLFHDIGLRLGQSLPHLVYDEVDAVRGTRTSGVQVLASSAPRCPQRLLRTRQDTTLRRLESGAVVFDAGTLGWVCTLGDECPWGRAPTWERQAVTAMTRNVLQRLARAPADGRVAPPA